MGNSEVSLLRQLSANSDPYRDLVITLLLGTIPLAALDWRSLSLNHYWLPPEALSLHGLAEFNALSEAAKMLPLQMVDDARHIACARARLDAMMMQRHAITERFYSKVIGRLFNQFVRAYFLAALRAL